MLKRYFPILEWSKGYDRATLTDDLVAAVIVTIMLIPQSLAYALLAGLPPEMGLYAAILPLLAYALFGNSRTLAVGPVAVVSLMTAAVVGEMALQGTAEYAAMAIALAMISGVILLVMGLFRLGFLANFLSHPVISGFMIAATLIIATSQVKHIFGISASGSNLIALVGSLAENMASINLITLTLGVAAIGLLYWARRGMKPILVQFGVDEKLAGILSKTGPILVVVLTTAVTWALNLADKGVSVVGALPSGFPPFATPTFDIEIWGQLFGSAVLISIVGFVESISVAQTLAAKRRQRISPDQELVGLGAANIAAAFSGGYPVTGGLSRSMVNFDSGAKTPAAGAFTAIGVLTAAIFLTPLLYFLPKATLAAIIIVAVVSLLNLGTLKQTWQYSRTDFAAMAATIILTLAFGVELGIMAGVGVSIFLHLYRTSRPHSAIVGQVPGTEHFRNVNRHEVIVTPEIFTIRIDESLYFPNARFLEDTIYDAVASNNQIEHVVLMCSAVNFIDASALESLEAINERLGHSDVMLHLSEVKGPVMDRLKRSHFLEHLSGRVYLTQFDAVHTINPHVANRAMEMSRVE
ncbi:MAG: sodium-independent anion transporter [Rhodobacteraceae bacterium]|nr:MAG: sodium-independent anion transporter [Paracoccaceae bacterium]